MNLFSVSRIILFLRQYLKIQKGSELALYLTGNNTQTGSQQKIKINDGRLENFKQPFMKE